MLFSGLVKTRIDWTAAGPMLGVVAVGTGAGMLLGLGARLLPISPVAFASQYQCTFRFNSYIGLALAGTLHGMPGIAAMGVAIGLMVPPVNIVAIWTLARHGEAGVWRELARNPLIFATLAGLAANLGGFEPPTGLLDFLGRLAQAAVVLGLLAVGAGLRLSAANRAADHATAAYLLAVKMLAVPAIALLLIRGTGLDGLYADIALIFCALPTASSAYILAQRMGGDGAGVARLISAGTLLGMLSIPAWLILR